MGEVHFASCVLKFSRYNGYDRYIVKTFKPIKVPAVRLGTKAEWYRGILSPLFVQGRLFFVFYPVIAGEK